MYLLVFTQPASHVQFPLDLVFDNLLAYRSARSMRGPITDSHPQVKGIGPSKFPNVATIDRGGGLADRLGLAAYPPSNKKDRL